jgi:hypothetical protein
MQRFCDNDMRDRVRKPILINIPPDENGALRSLRP